MALTYTDRHPVELAQTGIAIALTPAIDAVTNLAVTAPLEVQRAPDSSGSPNAGAAVTVAMLPAISPGGTIYIDPLPLTASRYWYRFRHVVGAGGGTWGAWNGPFEAVEVSKEILGAVRNGPGLTATLDPAWTQTQARPGTHTQQLLPNMGFEDGPPFWVVGTGTLIILTDSTKAQSGNRYAQLTSVTGTPATALAADDVGQPRYFEVNPGDVIQFGGWLYRESGTANVRYVLELTDKDKANPTTSTTANQNTAAWLQVQGQQLVPAGKKYARVWAEIDATGTGVVARVDDVFLRIAFGASTVLNQQGSIAPTPLGGATDGAGLGATYASGGAVTGHMWLAWRWGVIGATPGPRTIYRPDGTSITVPYSGTPAVITPTLAQVAGGALGARTRFVRVALVKNGGGPSGALALRTYPTPVLATDGEASLAILANNLLKVTGPAAVAGYDGWTPLVGTVSQAEVVQGDPPVVVAFGTDWTEPVGGAQTSSATNTPYNWPGWSGAWVFIGLAASTSFYAYPYYDTATADSFWVAAISTNSDQQAVAARTQYGDGHCPLTSGGLLGATPAAAGSGSGTPATGGGTGSNQKLLT